MSYVRVACHESGHALALLSFGVPVVALHANASGGGCTPAAGFRYLPPMKKAFVLLAGGYAPRAVGDYEAEPSCFDFAALADLHLFRDELRSLDGPLSVWAWENARPLKYLASQLMAAGGRLGLAGLADLVHATGSPLSEFRSVYPRAHKPAPTPAPPKALTGAPADCPAARLPGARWSAEHGCYLAPLTRAERAARRGTARW